MNERLFYRMKNKKAGKIIFYSFFLLYLCKRNWFAATSCRRRHGLCVVIKRESGEKPGQSRCCKRLIAASTMVTDIFSGRPLAMSLRTQVRRPAVAIGNNMMKECL